LAWLVEQGFLGNADIDYGITYMTCRDAHPAYPKQRGCKSFLDISTLTDGSAVSCEESAELFSLMTASIGQKFCKIIEYPIDTVRGPDAAPNYRPPYRLAFTALAKAFEQAVKELQERKRIVSLERNQLIAEPLPA
jgi:hypothetical protein